MAIGELHPQVILTKSHLGNKMNHLLGLGMSNERYEEDTNHGCIACWFLSAFSFLMP